MVSGCPWTTPKPATTCIYNLNKTKIILSHNTFIDKPAELILALILNQLVDLNTIVNNFEFRRTKNLLLYVDEICIKISKNSFAKMLLFVCPQPSPKGVAYFRIWGALATIAPKGPLPSALLRWIDR